MPPDTSRKHNDPKKQLIGLSMGCSTLAAMSMHFLTVKHVDTKTQKTESLGLTSQ